MFRRFAAKKKDEPTERQQVHDSLDAFLSAHPDAETRILEQINPTAIASSPTQEDWY